MAGVGQLGYAMHQRPGLVSQVLGIAGGQLVGGLAVAHETEQRLEAALGGGRALGIGGLIARRIEHGGEVLRPAQGEIHVGKAAAAQAIDRAGPRTGAGHGAGETVEAIRSHGRQQIVPVAEMAVGSVVRDAGAAGRLAQGEAARAGFGDQLDGRLEQGFLQVSVMIGPGGGHNLTVPNNVDSSNFSGVQCC